MNDKRDLQYHLDHLIVINTIMIRLTLTLGSLALTILFYWYGLLLSSACISQDVMIRGVLSLTIQIPFGLFIIRQVYDAGSQIGNKYMLSNCQQFQWSRILRSVTTANVDVQDLSKIFERFQVIYTIRSSRRIDDVSDVGWFLLVVSAVLSTFFVVFSDPSLILCYGVVIFQCLLTIMMFILGYTNTDVGDLEDYLVHLEYVVVSLVRRIVDDLSEVEQPAVVVKWCRWFHKSLLQDILIRVGRVEFTLCLTSERPARILIEDEPQFNDILSELSSDMPTKWWMEKTGSKINLLIPQLKLDLADAFSWMISPTTLESILDELTPFLQKLVVRTHAL